MTTTVDSADSVKRQGLGANINLRSVGIYLVLIGLVLFASRFVPGFATTDNAINIFQRSVVLGLVAVGQTFVIIGGSLDLSVGTAISVIGVIGATLMDSKPENMAGATAVALGVGAFIGLINGLLITQLKINAFIATLGVSLIVQGFLYSSFNNYAGKVPEAFQGLAYNNLFGIPIGVYILIATVLLAWFLLRFTRFGYHLYAVGGNRNVARLSGVRTGPTIIAAHVLAGLGAALAAVILIARLRSGDPRVGVGYDLDSIAAVVVGGTFLAGGQGSVWGTLAGVLIVSILDSIFNALNVGAFVQNILRGVIVIVVVAFYSYQARK